MPIEDKYDKRLLASLEIHEGLRLVAYKDTVGVWTIGFGHNLEANGGLEGEKRADWKGYTITQEQAIALLEQDLDRCMVVVEATEEWPFMNSKARQNALIELIFNMGLGNDKHGYTSFANTRRAMREQDWGQVRAGLMDSKWYKQVGKGRGEYLCDLFYTGWYGGGFGLPRQPEAALMGDA